MVSTRRYQDGLTAILGVALFVSPFVFGETSNSGASWTAYVLGVLIFLVGLAMLAYPAYPIIEYGAGLLGIAAFVSPWVIGFAGLASMAWTAWIIGAAVFVIAGLSILASRGRQPSTA